MVQFAHQGTHHHHGVGDNGHVALSGREQANAVEDYVVQGQSVQSIHQAGGSLGYNPQVRTNIFLDN